jgi:hypothetical protein
MTRTSRLAAAAALLIAGSAFAEGTFVPEVGLSYIKGKQVESGTGTTGNRNSWALGAAFGYEFDNGLGVRALAFGDMQPFRGVGATRRTFDNFVGVQATGSLPLASQLNLKGGLGVGRTNLDQGPNSDTRTDAILSIGLQWRIAKHYAMELRVDHLTASATTSAGLQFQVPF